MQLDNAERAPAAECPALDAAGLTSVLAFHRGTPAGRTDRFLGPWGATTNSSLTRAAQSSDPGRLAIVDGVGSELARAEQDFRARFEAELAPIVARGGGRGGWSDRDLESLRLRLSEGSNAERGLLAMLAYRCAERSQNANHAAALAERALAGGSLLADPKRLPEVLAAAAVLGLAGRSPVAEALYGEIIARARRSGSSATLAVAHSQRGLERYRLGALDQARLDLNAALEVAAGRPWETMVDDGRAHLLRLRTEIGELDQAELELKAWLADGPLPDTAVGHRLLIERGRLRLAQARFEEATTDFAAASVRLGERKDSILYEWRSPAALARYGLGQEQAARALAQRDLEIARAWGAPRQVAVALMTVGLIERSTSGIDATREALAALDGSTARLERARAFVNLGVLLRRAGAQRQARAELLAGLDWAKVCGAKALARFAEQELAATGATRRRRTMLSGVEALTPSEHRVARMAADGLSNPEIAAALFISRKTVEMHLGNAYRKLHIGSRQQLASPLAQGRFPS